MPLIRSALIYAGLALCANAALNAAWADQAALEALRLGDMQRLVLSAAKPRPEATLLDLQDGAHSLAEFQGKVVLLNFWATWCAPCRAEMPALDQLQADLGAADFAVVPVATGPNPVPAIEKFFAEAGLVHLTSLRDPKQAFARQMGVLGLPMTVILNRDGQEVGRLIGTADWNGPAARALIAALIAEDSPSP